MWHLTEMLLPYLEERANTFVSSINQHYCPLVLQEVELALFFEVRIQHFCQVPCKDAWSLQLLRFK